jgi:gliding motility-associated-like protein
LASGNTSVFEWSPAASLDNAFIHNPIASPTVSTKYMVVGKSQYSCPNDTDFVQVTVGSIPLLQVIADTATLAGKSVQLLASVTNSLPVSYQWEPPDGLSCTNCPDPVATVNTDRTYTVTVTSDLGCEAMDTVHVNTFCDDQLYIPNSFTPNSDGLNDIFYIKAPGEGIIKAMYIYNRWGEVVFEKKDFNLNDPGAGWDGKVHGDDVTNSHVFSYVIYLTCKKGLDYTVIGSVTILK